MTRGPEAHAANTYTPTVIDLSIRERDELNAHIQRLLDEDPAGGKILVILQDPSYLGPGFAKGDIKAYLSHDTQLTVGNVTSDKAHFFGISTCNIKGERFPDNRPEELQDGDSVYTGALTVWNVLSTSTKLRPSQTANAACPAESIELAVNAT
ncbi:hypothetical protein IAT40_005897 [Kwoniella sp. CBS 6097]